MRMHSVLIKLTLLFGAVVQAVSSVADYSIGRIEWGACDAAFEEQNVKNLRIECAKLDVPLDYELPDGKQLGIDILRVPAPKSPPAKASIFVSLGGPGSLGRQSLMSNHEMLLSATGYQHHLIAFDARGTGDTLPMTCFNTTTEPFRYTYPNETDTGLDDIWRNATVVADTCYKEKKDIGQYLGTTAVARDLMRIVDALPEDNMVRFWGQSHGTLLGATVAAIFPNRIDKLLFDGAVNAHEYYNSYETETIRSADDVQMGFFESCLDAPLYCRLTRAGHHNTVENIKNVYYNFLFGLKEKPIPFNDRLMTYTMLKRAMALSLRWPSSWARFSLAVYLLYEGKPATFAKYYDDMAAAVSNHSTAEAAFGIACGDKSAAARDLKNLGYVVTNNDAVSITLSEDILGTHVTCAQWKMSAKERYKGKFHVRTKNPALFIGTAYDPVTPFASANNMSSTFKDSILLRHEGYGNGLLAQPSACTLRAVRKYFTDSKMPAENTTCKPDFDLFDWRSVWNIFRDSEQEEEDD